MSDYVTKQELKDELSVFGANLKTELKTELKADLNLMFDDFGAKIFRYFDGHFVAINERFDQMDSRIDTLEGTVDSFAKRMEILTDESTVRDYKTDRHERWIGQLADKTGLKLEY